MGCELVWYNERKTLGLGERLGLRPENSRVFQCLAKGDGEAKSTRVSDSDVAESCTVT